ncbi:MAG: hypothetical protein WC943_08560 [Elusimicrobiota bacterium]|jgi:hypothetical protein
MNSRTAKNAFSRIVAGLLCAGIVVVSPGVDAYAAAVIVRTGSVAGAGASQAASAAGVGGSISAAGVSALSLNLAPVGLIPGAGLSALPAPVIKVDAPAAMPPLPVAAVPSAVPGMPSAEIPAGAGQGLLRTSLDSGKSQTPQKTGIGTMNQGPVRSDAPAAASFRTVVAMPAVSGGASFEDLAALYDGERPVVGTAVAQDDPRLLPVSAPASGAPAALKPSTPLKTDRMEPVGSAGQAPVVSGAPVSSRWRVLINLAVEKIKKVLGRNESKAHFGGIWTKGDKIVITLGKYAARDVLATMARLAYEDSRPEMFPSFEFPADQIDFRQFVSTLELDRTLYVRTDYVLNRKPRLFVDEFVGRYIDSEAFEVFGHYLVMNGAYYDHFHGDGAAQRLLQRTEAELERGLPRLPVKARNDSRPNSSSLGGPKGRGGVMARGGMNMTRWETVLCAVGFLTFALNLTVLCIAIPIWFVGMILASAGLTPALPFYGVLGAAIGLAVAWMAVLEVKDRRQGLRN